MDIKEEHLKEFVKRAEDMRLAQKAYFQKGGKDRVMAAKIAEGYFDKALTWFKSLIEQPQQTGKQQKLNTPDGNH